MAETSYSQPLFIPSPLFIQKVQNAKTSVPAMLYKTAMHIYRHKQVHQGCCAEKHTVGVVMFGRLCPMHTMQEASMYRGHCKPCYV